MTLQLVPPTPPAPKLSIDFETRSTVALPDTGVYVYAKHASTDLWCMAYAFDGEPVDIWFPGQPFPPRIAEHIASGGIIRAHNAQFERIMWEHCARPKHNFPFAALEQFECSAAEAAAMSLPRSLGECARVLGVAVQKDTEGYNLMMRMCRPRSVQKDGTLVWWDVPERVNRLAEYCKTDVDTERAISKALRRLSADEREVYLLDQRINDRGFGLDVDLVTNAKLVVQEGVARANAALTEITSGDVTTITNHGRLTAWLNENGAETDSVSKAAVQEMLLRDGLEPAVRKVLELRAMAGRSSVAKLDTMLECNDNGRVRGTLLYHGASTGRWTGKGVQPQNLPRGDVANAERFIPLILKRDYDTLNFIENPIAVVSSLLRACIIPAPGNVFIGGDFSAIEARVLCWLAGQENVVQMFREGQDVYAAMAAGLFPADSTVEAKHRRQMGKFAVLGCGYGMGAAKAVDAAKAPPYFLELDDVTAQRIITTYRNTHPMVTNFWAEANRSAINAVTTPGVGIRFGFHGNLQFLKAGNYLYLQLPSKRMLCYPAPAVVMAPTPWGEERPAVEFSSVDSYTRKWGRSRLYGGLIAENIVQAVSRDLMVHAMLELEKYGFTLVLTVHDEVLAECEVLPGTTQLTEQEFGRILSTPPDWAGTLPLAAETWTGVRYQK
jgi:DNA polymerase